MRRKKDDKRVLRRGNGRDTKQHRRPTNIIKRNNKSRNRNTYRSRNDNWNRNRKPKKRSRKTVLLMILVLVAFIIGAGIGVMMSFDNGNGNSTDANETHIENVTVEMTTNLNETEDVVFDEADDVDFNENQTSEILGAEKNPYYYDDGLEH